MCYVGYLYRMFLFISPIFFYSHFFFRGQTLHSLHIPEEFFESRRRSVSLNHNQRDINQSSPTVQQLPALSIEAERVSLQTPRRDLPARSAARSAATRVRGRCCSRTSRAANRISCCFIRLSLNPCHHMFLLAQERALDS